MNKSIISVVLLVLLFLGSVETFAQKQIVRRVPNEPVVPQKQAQPAKTPTHHAPKKKRGYDYVAEYSEGLAMVRLNYKYGFIDKSGTEVIPRKYDQAESFSEGLAKVYSIINMALSIKGVPKLSLVNMIGQILSAKVGH